MATKKDSSSKDSGKDTKSTVVPRAIPGRVPIDMSRERVAMKDNTDSGLEKLKSALEQRRRNKQEREDEEDVAKPAPPVSLGPAGAIVDALINTSPEKLLELTDFDRNQVSLIPQVVVIDDMWDYIEQVMFYRTDKDQYTRTFKRRFPETPDTSGKFVHVLAQCRRSLGGKMKKALEDMALAELETRSDNDMGGVGGHDFED